MSVLSKILLSISTGFARYFSAEVSGNTIVITDDENSGSLAKVQCEIDGANFVRLNTVPSGVPATTGTMSWNTAEDCAEIKGTNNTIQVGQELAPPFRNATGADIPDMTPVMYAGTVGNSGIVKIQKAIADGTLPAFYILGVTTELIENGTDGHVTWFGKVRNVDATGTPYGETWADEDILYVSPTTAGYFTKVAPEAPNLRIPVAIVVHAHSNGSIYVRPSWFPKFTDLDDVDGVANVSGQFYLWDNVNKYFKPTANITINDATPTVDTNNNDLVIDCGPEKTMRLEEPVWKDIDFPIVIRTTGTNIPTVATVLGNLSMARWQVNDFNNCEIQEIVHEWEQGTDIHWHIHIVTAAQDATDRYVNWEIEYNYANIYIPSVSPAYTSDMSWQGSNSVVTSGNSIIPANTPIRTNIIIPIYTWAYAAGKIGAHVKARLRRIAVTGGVAEPSADPFCEMLQMHVLCDTMGSRKIGNK